MNKFLVVSRVLRDDLTRLSAWAYDGKRICWGLEDAARAPGDKVPGQTSIPAGTYPLALRTEGAMHPKYARRYPQMHKGMLWLRHVPFFEYIYIHPGNFMDDTLGCLLPGLRPGPLGAPHLTVEQSGPAYEHLYRLIVSDMEAGHSAYAVVRDLDQGTDSF